METHDLKCLRRRIAETIAWCRLRADFRDPAHSLRTSGLRSDNCRPEPDEWGHLLYDWGSLTDKTVPAAAVESLARKRADALILSRFYPAELPHEFANGRLLIFDPDYSDWSGLSEAETRGFIDVRDVPPWDTWIGYFSETAQADPSRPYAPASVAYLLSWVPPELLAEVNDGILVNPVECFFWASAYRAHGYDTPTLRLLDEANLLR